MKLFKDSRNTNSKTPKMILQDFRITYYNESIRVILKFQGSQKLVMSYPREFDPAVISTPYHCITEHLMEANNYWCKRAISFPGLELPKIMYRRTKIMQAYLEKYIEQESGKGWK